MTKPDLMAELAEVVKQMGFDLPQCHARDAAYAFIKAHHAELEAVVRDAKSWRLVTSDHAMPDGTVAKCHVNVGVNVWRGEEWLAFHQCEPEQLRQIVEEAMHNSAREG